MFLPLSSAIRRSIGPAVAIWRAIFAFGRSCWLASRTEDSKILPMRDRLRFAPRSVPGVLVFLFAASLCLAVEEITYPGKEFAKLDTFEGLNLEDADKLFGKKDLQN